jgi:hypothetical protein
MTQNSTGTSPTGASPTGASPTGASPQSQSQVPVSHEMFMRYDKARLAYDWKMTEDAPVIVILESQVPELISSTQRDVPETLERSSKTLFAAMRSMQGAKSKEWNEAATCALAEKFNAVVLEIKNGGYLECNPAFIQEALGLVSEIEKIALATSISLPIKGLFSQSRILIKEIQKQSEIFIVLQALLDTAKKDPNGNWVSASDKPIAPGQVQIPVGG